MTTESLYAHQLTECQWRALAMVDDQEWEIFRASDPAKLGGQEINAETNIKRAIACWNACVGIPTEQLEAVSFTDLIEALDGMLGAYDYKHAFKLSVDQTAEHHRNARAKARAALAPLQKESD